VSARPSIVAVLTLVACRDRDSAEVVRKSPLETAIARDLTARLAVPVSASCVVVAKIPLRCEATLVDGTRLPIEIASEGKEWSWRVAGLVVETAPVAAYVDATLADLHIAQHASCGPRIVVVQPGDRLGCALTAGGMAFVRFARDGTASLELELDPASAKARGEPVTAQRDRELTSISRALETLEGESDGEEEVPADGGVPGP
jgi:hypothetical protein